MGREDSYIVLNGERIELTEDLAKVLATEVAMKNPFQPIGRTYYIINNDGRIRALPKDGGGGIMDAHCENVNCFNDHYEAMCVAATQLLYRKLLKFAFCKNCKDTAPWDGLTPHYFIRYNIIEKQYEVAKTTCHREEVVYFSSEEGALAAIKDVIKPFEKDHPEFVWGI